MPLPTPGMYACPVGKDISMKLSLSAWASSIQDNNDAEMDRWLTLMKTESELVEAFSVQILD